MNVKWSVLAVLAVLGAAEAASVDPVKRDKAPRKDKPLSMSPLILPDKGSMRRSTSTINGGGLILGTSTAPLRIETSTPAAPPEGVLQSTFSIGDVNRRLGLPTEPRAPRGRINPDPPPPPDPGTER